VIDHWNHKPTNRQETGDRHHKATTEPRQKPAKPKTRARTRPRHARARTPATKGRTPRTQTNAPQTTGDAGNRTAGPADAGPARRRPRTNRATRTDRTAGTDAGTNDTTAARHSTRPGTRTTDRQRTAGNRTRPRPDGDNQPSRTTDSNTTNRTRATPPQAGRPTPEQHGQTTTTPERPEGRHQRTTRATHANHTTLTARHHCIFNFYEIVPQEIHNVKQKDAQQPGTHPKRKNLRGTTLAQQKVPRGTSATTREKQGTRKGEQHGKPATNPTPGTGEHQTGPPTPTELLRHWKAGHGPHARHGRAPERPPHPQAPLSFPHKPSGSRPPARRHARENTRPAPPPRTQTQPESS